MRNGQSPEIGGAHPAVADSDVAGSRRVWQPPQIIGPEAAKRARVSSPTSTPFPDTHGGATTANGS